MTLYCSHGASFGVLVSHLRWLFFLLGRRHWGSFNFGSSPNEGFIWQIDVFFTTLKQKPSITFFFSIVQKQGFFGNNFLLSLQCLGFFSLRLKRYSLDGMGSLWVKFAKSPRRLPHYVSFGLFGKKGACLLLIC